MRLAPIPPAELSKEQKPLYETLHAGIYKHLSSLKAAREDGALLSPFNPCLEFTPVYVLLASQEASYVTGGSTA